MPDGSPADVENRDRLTHHRRARDPGLRRRTTAFMEALGAGGVRVLRGVEDDKAYARGMNNVATARGLMTILVRLAERSVVSEKASDEMLGVLRGQKFHEGIPAGLPPGTSVA